MIIRRADTWDLSPVAAIVDAAYRPWIVRIGRPPGPMLDDYDVRIAAGQVLVAVEDTAIVGLIVLEVQPDHLLIDNVAVAPSRQGRGLGRALLQVAERQARERGLTELRLYTHVLMTENIAMYLRLGFVETSRAEQSGFQRVFMARTLNTEAG